MKRLSGLDYLKGLCACLIMSYHYSLWNFGTAQSGNFLTRMGIYGVSVFYILSGITLCHVYYEKIDLSLKSVRSFFTRRIFRIFPLLWFSIAATILVTRQVPDFSTFITNVTGAFSVYKWDETVVYGSWSIGNELAFYLLFIPVIILIRNRRLIFFVALLASLGLYIWYSHFVINPKVDLVKQWRDYTNPLNQVFLFLAGIAIAALSKNAQVSNRGSMVILVISIFGLVFYPTEGLRTTLIFGINRLLFTLFCFGICFGFYKSSFALLPAWLDYILKKLGESSYSIYLLHPIVYKVCIKFGSLFSRYFPINQLLLLTVSGICTLAFCYLIYKQLEKRFISIGGKVAELQLQ